MTLVSKLSKPRTTVSRAKKRQQNFIWTSTRPRRTDSSRDSLTIAVGDWRDKSLETATCTPEIHEATLGWMAVLISQEQGQYPNVFSRLLYKAERSMLLFISLQLFDALTHFLGWRLSRDAHFPV